jgi:hypothetical protein
MLIQVHVPFCKMTNAGACPKQAVKQNLFGFRITVHFWPIRFIPMTVLRAYRWSLYFRTWELVVTRIILFDPFNRS